MEWIVILLVFVTIPCIIIQSMTITNLERDREQYKKMLEHRDNIIVAYDKRLRGYK